jgi:hypothetical protein
MNTYEEEACEFKNESECEEALDERGTTMEEVEQEHFQDKDLEED